MGGGRGIPVSPHPHTPVLSDWAKSSSPPLAQCFVVVDRIHGTAARAHPLWGDAIACRDYSCGLFAFTLSKKALTPPPPPSCDTVSERVVLGECISGLA